MQDSSASTSTSEEYGDHQQETAQLQGSGVCTSLQYALRYLFSATKHDAKGWAIGTLTVFLVVFFISLLQSNVVKSPLIFLRLTENTVGEVDLLMTPQPTYDRPTFFLNYSEISTLLANEPLVSGSAPRWFMLGKIANRDFPEQETSVIFVIADTELEESAGIGRAWPHRILGEGETHVTDSVLRDIGILPNRGGRVVISMDLLSLAQSFGVVDENVNNDTALFQQLGLSIPTLDPTVNVPNITVEQLAEAFEAVGVDPDGLPPGFLEGLAEAIPAGDTELPPALQPFGPGGNLSDLTTLSAEYTVVDAVEGTFGKYPSAIGNVAVIDSRFVQKLLIDTGRATLDNALIAAALGDQADQLSSFLDAFNINEYALTVYLLYRDRTSAYLDAEAALKKHMVDFSNAVMEALGQDYPVDVALPIEMGLETSFFIRLFLDQIFNFVLFILCFLGSTLVYSLLLSDVEHKTYEYGMLRALGMRHHTLIEMLISQAMLFAIPGICVGLLVAFLVDIPIAFVLGDFASLDPTFGLAPGAIVLGVLIGLLVPLVSNYVPIKRALSKTLRDSLDVYHQVISETSITVTRLESLGLSTWQTAIAVIMVVVGFVTYYLIPYSFTFQNFGLFFTILNGILLGMLFGLSLIAQVVQPYLERAALWLTMWGKHKRFIPIVRKNLAGHRPRNSKTALMFTTALAFLIFAGALFTLQTKLIQDSIELLLGADVVVNVPRWANALDEDALRVYLNNQIARPNAIIEAFSFVTFPLSSLDVVRYSEMSTLARFGASGVELYGLEENFLQTTYNKFVVTTEVDDAFEYSTVDGKTDVVASLYTHAGQARLPIEEEGIAIPPVVASVFPHLVNNTADLRPVDGGSDGGSTSPDTDGNSGEDRVDHNSSAPYYNYDVSVEVYTRYVDVIFSEGLRDAASVSTDTPLYLFCVSQNTTFYYLGKARAMVSKMPSFFFSSYRSFSFGSPVLLSMPQYQYILDEILNNTNSEEYLNGKPLPIVPPKGKLLVRTRENATKEEREDVANGIRNFIDDDTTEVTDTRSLVESTDVATDMLVLFFNIVAAIASLLSFFVLLLSFTANVRENSWEFGVLRAVGLAGNEVLLIFLFEAIAIILACIVLGTIIGLVVAVALTLQLGLFTESVFQFDFPYTLFASILVMSFVVAVFGSWLPARGVLKMEVARAIRG